MRVSFPLSTYSRDLTGVGRAENGKSNVTDESLAAQVGEPLVHLTATAFLSETSRSIMLFTIRRDYVALVVFVLT